MERNGCATLTQVHIARIKKVNVKTGRLKLLEGYSVNSINRNHQLYCILASVIQNCLAGSLTWG
jgi:hypothetical protein